MQKIHFHSFDAFRFFAFFKVYIFHATAVPVIVFSDGSFLKWIKDHLAYGGGIGVSFFFVLSGFLITYILTHDKIQYGNIGVKKFFVRRAFRIWPLFYLLVIMALVIPDGLADHIGFHMVGGGYEPDWRYSLSFLENYKMLIEDNAPMTTPLSVFWSLCVEEQFYIGWMIAFFFIGRKYLPVYLISSVVMAWIFRINHDWIYGTENVTNNDLFTNMDYFAISGLLGYFVAVNYKKVAKWSSSIPLVLKVLYVSGVIVALLYQKAIFSHQNWFMANFKYTIYSLMFAILIFLFIPQDSKMRFSEKNILTRLGKISYGLYVYHIMWVHFVLRFFLDYGIQIDGWRSYFIYIFITFAGTVITAVISYRYFEKPLLKYREKLFPSNSK